MDLTNFDHYLKSKQSQFRVPFDHEVPQKLEESVYYSLLAPGKRIRPRIVAATSEMLGLSEKVWQPLAASIEMIHCFTLIHDDLPCLDDDDTRRGKPSNHKVFGEAIALLAGDGLMPVAFETLMDAADHLDPKNFQNGLRRYLRSLGPHGVIGGQALELSLEAAGRVEDLEQIQRLKTGALFDCCILTPMDFAGVADDSAEGLLLKDFSRSFGTCFQFADDIEDKEQDDNEKQKTQVSKNLMHFMNHADAKAKYIPMLEDSVKNLESKWGEGAKSLCAIGQAMLDRIG